MSGDNSNVVSRPSAKKHGSLETDSFLAQSSSSMERELYLFGIPLPRGVKTSLVFILKTGAAIYMFLKTIFDRIIFVIVSNPVFIFLRRIVEAIVAYVWSYLMPIYDEIPEDSAIHVFTCVLVIAGVLTLFISPAFRSKLSEMRVRPSQLQNGIIDAMAIASDQYNVIRDDLIAPRETCTESHFRCEYYWASATNEAMDTSSTYYCTAYVCQGMTVRVHTLPQSCSGSNRVGIGALLKDIYGKPVYSCGNSGCGDCSSLRYSNLEEGPVSFLQGCDEEESCYGEIAVSITWDDNAATLLKEPRTKGSWSRFRGGPFNQGSSRASGLGGSFDPTHPPVVALQWNVDIEGGGIRSSPIISGTNVIYFGADDQQLYAVNAGEFAVSADTGGDGSSDNGFRKKRERAATPGNILWKYKTEGNVVSSPGNHPSLLPLPPPTPHPCPPPDSWLPPPHIVCLLITHRQLKTCSYYYISFIVINLWREKVHYGLCSRQSILS